MEKFIRVRSLKDITISLLSVIAGTVLVILPTSVSVNIVGFFLIFAGIILMIVLRTAYKDSETGEIFMKKEKYFPQSKRDSIARAISSDIENVDCSEEDKGNGLRLDVYYNRKSGHSFIQLFEYIPYKYESCTPVYSYDFVKIQNLVK